MSGIPVLANLDGVDKPLMLIPDSWDLPASVFHQILGERLGVGADQVDITIERTGHFVDPTMSADQSGVRAGDRLIVRRRGSTPSEPVNGGARLVAVEGPHAGQSFPLIDGASTIGRGDSATIRLANDVAASRSHAQLRWSGGRAEIEDLGSTNGTELDGVRITSTVPLRDGSVVGIGDTKLVLYLPGEPLGPHLNPAAGRLRFNRPPRVTTPDPSVEIKVAVPPEAPPKRRLPVASAAVPLVLGVVMAAVMGQPAFLLFTLMSPVMVVGSFIEDRRSGRSEFKKKSEAWLDELQAHADRAVASQRAEIAWRRDRWPEPIAALAEVASGDARLWQRRPGDADFADLRIGLSDLPSGVTITMPDGGADELRNEAAKVIEAVRVDHDVPVVVPLRDLGVVGLAGADRDRAEVLNWWLLQLAVHHSPRDLELVVLAPRDLPDIEWTSWLPHVTRPGADVPSVAESDADSRLLFASVKKLIDSRRAESGRVVGSRRWEPLMVLVVVAPLDASPAEVSELMRDAASVGLAVIWSARTTGELPNETAAVVALGAPSVAQVTISASGESTEGVSADRLSLDQAETAARGLAPLVDVSAGSGAGELPTSVPLFDVLGIEQIDASVVAARWADPPPRLTCTVGVNSAGAHSIDLVTDGPHGLMVGMTGAGKSGALQALVGSLAATHPPSSANFMFVDFKGGVGFGPLINLPHSVGLVTDLDARMAKRALASLEAELHRREIMTAEAGVEGITDLNRVRPGALAYLVIFVDEFAKLKTEVPEFIDGLVDVAQRGRSLGVHLMLAGQEAGKIDESLKLNSNLKIALRVATDAASSDLIDRPDAGQLPEKTPGRAVIKAGHRFDTVQFAFGGGAAHLASLRSAGATAHTISLGRHQQASAMEVDPTDTDLHRLVQACLDAHAASGAAPVHRPWLDPLPEMIELDDLTSGPSDTVAAVAGLLDDPAHQTQLPWTVDLEQHGSAIVFGSSGAGTSTALRTIAVALARQLSPSELNIYAFDFGSSRSLGPLTQLPHCGDVVSGGDLDRVRRLVAMLSDEAERRRQILGESGGGSIADLRRQGRTDAPSILVLIDVYSAFWSALEPLDNSEHLDAVQALITEGRSLGLHFVLSADRRNAIPPNVAATTGLQLVMRLANRDEYASLGRPELAKAADLVNGRAFTPDGHEVQIAVLGGHAVTDQNEALKMAADELEQRWPGSNVVPVRLLPTEIRLTELGTGTEAGSALGVDERRGAVVAVDLDTESTFLIAGPELSGKSNAAATLASGFQRAGAEVRWLATRGPAAVPAGPWAASTQRSDQVPEVIEALWAEIIDLESSGQRTRRLIVIDDADELADTSFGGMSFQSTLDNVVRRGPDVGIAVVITMSSYRAASGFSGWLKSMKARRRGLLLQPDEIDGEIFSVRLPRRAGLSLPPGRGYLVGRGAPVLIQVALND